MSQKVLIKKSSVLGKIPLVTDLSYGELALNYADGKLYFKDSQNSIKSFDSAPQLSINDLTDVDTSTTPPNIGQTLKWNGTNWVPGNDETVGGTGTDADTLDGLDSSFFLNYNNLINKPTIPTVPTNISAFTNDAGYLTSFTETDPIYTASSWYTTTNNNINWDTAYSWGNHSLVGYLTGTSSIAWTQLSGVPTLFSGDYNDLINKPTLFSGSYNDLTNKPFIPSKTSEITNDSTYVIASDLLNYATTAQLTTELSSKQDTLVSGTNIKTINGQSILGSGDITISGGTETDTLDSVTTRGNTTTNSIIVGGLTVDTNTLHIDTIDNQIGIGTLAPLYDLHLYRPSAGTQVQFESTSNQNNLHVVSTSGDVTLGTWNNTNSTGYVGTANNDAFALVTNNTERVILNVDGSLTINPNGGYTLPLLDGPTGSLLTTSGAGDASWASIKTINGQSILGSGDITISGGSGGSLYTNTATTTDTTANQVVDTFALVDYRTVKYIIQATSASEVHSTEVTIMHNDVTAFMTEYNVMYSGAGKLFTTAADVTSTNARLLVTPLVSGLTIDVTRISLIARAFTGGGPTWPTDLESQTQSEIDLQTQSYPEKDLN